MNKRKKNIPYIILTLVVLIFFWLQSAKNDLFTIKKSVDNSHRDLQTRSPSPTDLRRYNENTKLYNKTLKKFPHRIMAKKYGLEKAALK